MVSEVICCFNSLIGLIPSSSHYLSNGAVSLETENFSSLAIHCRRRTDTDSLPCKTEWDSVGDKYALGRWPIGYCLRQLVRPANCLSTIRRIDWPWRNLAYRWHIMALAGGASKICSSTEVWSATKVPKVSVSPCDGCFTYQTLTSSIQPWQP